MNGYMSTEPAMHAYPMMASVLQPAPPGTFAPNPAIAPSTLAAMSAPVSGMYTTIPTQESMLKAVDSLKFFLATAPGHFDQGPYDSTDPVAKEERCLNRFQLPTGELISCVMWNGLYHITGTDIVRVLHFRFAAFGRPVRNPKKFEEGIFSDLRNLKSGTDATLEEPKSEFLELLFKYNCIRTQKKQKVFYWFSVPHDRLFLDALDRDLKREKLGVEPTTEAVAEPALSFVYNPNKSLFEQFTEQQALQDAEASAGSSQQQSTDSEGSGDEARSHQRSASASRHRPSSLTRADSSHENGLANVSHEADGSQILLMPPGQGDYRSANLSAASSSDASLSCPSSGAVSTKPSRTFTDPQASAIFGAFALFEGSPTYKQRRKPGAKRTSPLGAAGGSRAQESSPGIASQSERSGSPMYGQDNDGSAGSRSRPTSSCGLGISHAPSHEGLPSQDTSSLYAMPAHGLPPGASSYGLASAPSYAMPGPGDPCAGLVVGQNSMSALELSAAAAAQAVLEEGPGGNKTFVCPLYSCGRLFKRQEHLKRHLRIHTEEKPYPCNRCDKRFARTDNLAAHLKIHDKVAARAGSACSADQRALDADEDLVDDRAPSHEPSPHASLHRPLNGSYMSYAAGLPTPPTGMDGVQSAWSSGQFSSNGSGNRLLTPDQSPDPSVWRPSSLGNVSYMNAASGLDPRRLRSATPNDSRVMDGHPRHASAGATPGYGTRSSANFGGPLGPGVSPMMSSFQQQLSMVNSLNAEMQSDNASPNPYLHPDAAFASVQTGEGVGLGFGNTSPYQDVTMAPPTFPPMGYDMSNFGDGTMYRPQTGPASY